MLHSSAFIACSAALSVSLNVFEAGEGDGPPGQGLHRFAQFCRIWHSDNLNRVYFV